MEKIASSEMITQLITRRFKISRETAADVEEQTEGIWRANNVNFNRRPVRKRIGKRSKWVA
jgi:hypothetical protein